MNQAAATGMPGPWGQWRRRRFHRVIDWIVIVAIIPAAVYFAIQPGLIAQNDHGRVERSDSPSVILRLYPGLLPDDIEDYSSVLTALFDAQPAGLTVLLVVPALAAWAMWLRRTRPQVTLAISAVLLLLFGCWVPMSVAMYTYAAWFYDRRRIIMWLLIAAGAIGLNFLNALAILFFLATIATPLGFGLWIGTRRQLVFNLRERAEQLEREQHLMAERAVSAERTRIAREMHDVVAHRVSLMVLHCGGLEVSTTDPAVAETAGRIRDVGREALTELRDVLGVLRDESETEAPIAPQPVLADLGELVEGWRTTGMSVRYETSGNARTLPVRLERTAYRVVQEALTNAAKHAPGAPVQVGLDFLPGTLNVKVDNGRPTGVLMPESQTNGGSAPGRLPIGGYGLAGIRERVALAGGELTAGASPGGGWRVRAALPTIDDGPAAAEMAEE